MSAFDPLRTFAPRVSWVGIRRLETRAGGEEEMRAALIAPLLLTGCASDGRYWMVVDTFHQGPIGLHKWPTLEACEEVRFADARCLTTEQLRRERAANRAVAGRMRR